MIFSFFSSFYIYHIKYAASMVSEQGSVALLKKKTNFHLYDYDFLY